jgi:hypothetical protein
MYAASSKDSIYVYDLRHDQQQQQEKPQKVKEKKVALLRFKLAPPSISSIHRSTTSRYIELQRNPLPTTTGNTFPRPPPLPDGRSSPRDGDRAYGPATPPFQADPHERLIVARVVTCTVGYRDKHFELHVPARAFLNHFSAATERNRKRGRGGYKGEVVVPWSAWRNAVRATPPRKLTFLDQLEARMGVYGMRAVSHPPGRDGSALHVDSYLPPRTRRRRDDETREAGAGMRKGVATRGDTGETRQAIRLPREVEDKADFVSVLCEDALLRYKVRPNPSPSPVFLMVPFFLLVQLAPLLIKISHAYWYTF